MADLFISYSRKDISFARILHKVLSEHDLETWVDWQDIPPSTEWLMEVYAAIEAAHTFIFLLSDTSAISENCNLEIEHARKNNKRIIPIVLNDVEPSQIHPSLAAINWVFSRSKDELQSAIAALIEAIQTDYDWVKAHTRLQVRALEWERSKQDKSFLLHGTDLRQAEDWLAASPYKKLEPSLLQSRYIQSSRQAAARRLRSLLTGVAVALVATTVLGVLALINARLAQQQRLLAEEQREFADEQRGIAEEQRGIAEEQWGIAEEQRGLAEEQRGVAIEQARLARIRELTAISQLPGTRFDIALLLGIEVYNSRADFQTQSNLFRLTQINPQIYRMISTEISHSISFSPDGNTLASADLDPAAILLWDTTTGLPIGLPLEGSQMVTFSPDGKMLAIVGDNNSIILWNLVRKNTFGRLRGHSSAINSIAFSPDGKNLVSVGEDNKILLFDISTMKWIRFKKLQEIGKMNSILFSPLGNTIAFAGSDSAIRLLDPESMQIIGKLMRADDRTLLALDFSPDGKILASAGEDDLIILWDVESKQPIGEPLKGHSSAVSSLAFNPDGTILAAGSWDNSISFWDIDKRQPERDFLNVHLKRVNDIAFHPKGNILASCSEDGTIILWNLDRDLPLPYLPIGQQSNPPYVEVFSADGKMIALANLEGDITLWDLKAFKLNEFSMKDIEASGIIKMTFNPDATILVTESHDGKLVFWDTATGQFMYTLSISDLGGDFRMAFSPSGNLLAVGNTLQQGDDITLRDLSGDDPKSEMLGQNISNITSLAFSPDGKTLLIAEDEGFHIWDVQNNKRIVRFKNLHTDWPTAISFSPDGKYFVSGGGGTIVIWDTASWKPLSKALPAYSDNISKIVISPDGKTMVSTNGDGTLVLWDFETRQILGKPYHFGISQESGEFDLDVIYTDEGRLLKILIGDGVLLTLNVTGESWKSQLCEKAGRNFSQEEWADYFPNEPYRITCPQWPEGD